MEKGGRTETAEVQACRPRPQDSVGACAAHTRGRWKRKEWSGNQAGYRNCTERTTKAYTDTQHDVMNIESIQYPFSERSIIIYAETHEKGKYKGDLFYEHY